MENACHNRGSPQPAADLAPTPLDARHRLSVLVVEDEEITRELYQTHFDEWHLAIDFSFMTSAMEVLIDIAGRRPDLLITDLNMPGVDGIEMLRVIKRNKQLAAMQILVITGVSEKEINMRGGLPPNSHCQGKPINFDWLLGCVTALEAANRLWRSKRRHEG